MNKKSDYKYQWDESILDKIKDVTLIEDEINKIEILKDKFNMNNHRKHNKYIKEIYTFYKLYKIGFSVREISDFTSNFYNYRGIGVILKEANLTRDIFKAQKIGANKRDYGSIRNKAKETLSCRNTNLLGSTIEDYIRNKLDSMLYELLPKDYEIIIGKNTMNILKQYENDIPVIIIKNHKIFKFAIEFDGSYWHENNLNDEIKNKLLLNKRYELFRINSRATITSDGIFQYQNDLDEKINKVVDKIKEITSTTLKEKEEIK